MKPSAKRTKLSSDSQKIEIPSSVIVTFSNHDGERAGPPIDLPTQSSAKQLELLLNSLLGHDETLPYAFYLNDMEIDGSLQDSLMQLTTSTDSSQSFENTLNISYQPLSVFRVRPVTRCVETMPGHTDAVLHVSYSPDGRRLASGGGDMAVRFWNTSTSMPAHTCTGHRNHVLCTTWSPDGQSFVSADRSGEIRIWDPRTGLQKGQPLRGHSKWVTSLAFEPFHMNPKCVRLASASKDHTIKIWDIVRGLCETTICGHTDSVECVKWGGAGLLYTASRDRTIKVWAVDGHGRSQHMLVRTLTGHAHRINALALNCDHVLRTGPNVLGDKPIAGGADAESQEALKARQERKEKKEQERQRRREQKEKKARKAALSARIRSGAPIESHEGVGGSDEASALRASDAKDADEEDETKGGVDGSADGEVEVEGEGETEGGGDLPALQERARERYQALVGAEGEKLVSGSDDFTLFMWKPAENKTPLTRMIGHQQLVNHIAFSPDGRFLASASFDKKVKLWCGRTGRFLATLTGHVGSVYQVAWSPDSNFLVSASKDSTVKLWSVKDTKTAAATLPGHEDEVYALDWSPNASAVASGSKDRTIKIWQH